ncbi:MAG: radical SAM protein [Deltaproteobacteria bacterium]|nr:radical SAM protein [Deltaproteobacteria bacterium]
MNNAERNFMTAVKAGISRLGLTRIPLAVSFEITTRCTRKCLYCESWKLKRDELNTHDILGILDDLADNNTEYLSITGGEPLLRADLPDIVKRAKSLGMKVGLNTNGDLLPERIEDLEGVDKLVLSLDGPKHIQDRLRGKGSFDSTMAAIRLGQSHGIFIGATAVLTNKNLGSVKDILNLGRDMGIKVRFQPAYTHRLRATDENPAAPGRKDYQDAMRFLIKEKISGNQVIGNSVSVLKYLAGYPGPMNIQCAGGSWFMRIRADGKVGICGIGKDRPVPGIDIRDGVKRAMSRLAPPDCSACWCSQRTEINLAWSGHVDAMAGLLKYVF